MSKMQTENGLLIPLGTSLPGRQPPEDKLPPGKKPQLAADKTGAPPSRFSLRMTAGWWRSLQCVGMTMHFLAPPRPPNPSFSRTASSTLSVKKGDFKLHFYVPDHHESAEEGQTFPAVVNFHGGGFTLGNGTDDARFARFVVEKCNAIFVSVDYRLAPEFPFPVAVEDAADAILYIIRNAAELKVDQFKLATSGFSAGGNLAITAPLRLKAYLQSPNEVFSQGLQSQEQIPNHRILALVTWYPITDYTLTRAERRAGSIRPEHTLLPMFTNLFDASYLYPPSLDLTDPCLSPSQAPDRLLADAIPPHVLFYTCEWDMLLHEGENFATRLAEAPICKNVRYKMIEGVPHGWDKGPDPLRPPAQSEELYEECCEQLREIFESG